MNSVSLEGEKLLPTRNFMSGHGSPCVGSLVCRRGKSSHILRTFFGDAFVECEVIRRASQTTLSPHKGRQPFWSRRGEVLPANPIFR